jgi:hypothetical protein
MRLASTAIRHSGPSDRRHRSILAVDSRLFFFTEHCSVFFAPNVPACKSMTGGAKFSGSNRQRAEPLPTCASGRRPLARPLAGLFCLSKKSKKLRVRQNLIPQSRTPPPKPYPTLREETARAGGHMPAPPPPHADAGGRRAGEEAAGVPGAAQRGDKRRLPTRPGVGTAREDGARQRR